MCCDLLSQGLFDAAFDHYTRGVNEVAAGGGEFVQSQRLELAHSHLQVCAGELDDALEKLRARASAWTPSSVTISSAIADDLTTTLSSKAKGATTEGEIDGTHIPTHVKTLLLLSDVLQDIAITLPPQDPQAVALRQEALGHLLKAEKLVERDLLCSCGAWQAPYNNHPGRRSTIYLPNARLVPIVKERLATLLAALDATAPAFARVCEGLQAMRHIINPEANEQAKMYFYYGRLHRLSNERPSTPVAVSAVEMANARFVQWKVDHIDVIGVAGLENRLQNPKTSAYEPPVLPTEAALEQALITSFTAGGHNHQVIFVLLERSVC